MRTDAVLKHHQTGVIDLETAQEQLGYSPEAVRHMHDRRQATRTDPTAPSPATPDGTTPIDAGFTAVVTSTGVP